MQALLGPLILLTLAWIASENRRAVSLRLVLSGLALQWALGAVLLKLPWAREGFALLNRMAQALQTATDSGTQFVFGYLAGGPAPFVLTHPEHGFILAARALPLLLVISALSALLFHWRVLPPLVAAFAWLLRRTLGVGGALGLGAAANVFVGMTEAPLLIRPYLATLSRAALFGLMTAGLATVAGTVMVLYASILAPQVPEALGHILTASLMNVPAALVIAGIMVPPRAAEASVPLQLDHETHGAMDAIVRGTLSAIPLLLNIVALLIVMLALTSLVNQGLAWLPAVGGEPLTLQRLLGWLFAPVMWSIGIPWAEASHAGMLMGIKTVLNELLAYVALAQLPATALSEHSRLIMLYALCGFANIGSLGILIGGLGTLVPERRDEVVALGPRAVFAGTLATLLTGATAGWLL